MARLWEEIMTLQIEKATNASDLGEIINLEILSWKQLMINQWDQKLEDGLGQAIPADANPAMNYTGDPFVKVMPARTQVYGQKPFNLKVLIMGNTGSATLYYRSLGDEDYSNKDLSRVDRSVYEVTIPGQSQDFEYYIEAETSQGIVTYPASAPEISQTVVVGPGTLAGIQSNNLLEEFELQQNYPNPFNSSTIIKYKLPRNSKVKLVIYDLLGREVRELVNKRQSSGIKKIIWDGRNRYGNRVASGMYLYRIVAEKFSNDQVFQKTRKMLLLK